ncbi:MAG TPA: acyl-CoA synthetase [Acidimicrobiales bacterium]|nr:acyl-CoA synthetase [Acidimicrobiales bacterium]
MTTRQPGHHAVRRPDHPAVVMAGSGDTVTYAELEAGSNRLAHLLRSRGLEAGAHVAVLLPNHPRYFEVVWACLRSGLYITPINWHLGPEEAGYIVEDCDAEALVVSAELAPVVSQLDDHLGRVHTRLVLGGDLPGFTPLDHAVADQPSTPIDDEVEGSYMFYSSGTTGRPKGIKPPLSGNPFGTGGALELLLGGMYGFDEDSRYLCPAPLYHAAPLGWSVAAQRLGGTVVVMERFDPEAALTAIEEHRITKAQFVPTHFVRMLKLPEEERRRHDTSSLQTVIHAAAPCPVEVKRQMLEWWGPIIHEYYAGSEGNGFCAIGPEEWLAHPGSVGTPVMGVVHILDEDGTELGPGEPGQIWFESPTRFEYHKDPAKTAGAFNEAGWSSLGDVGYLDDEGFLYLTDRISHMIISGGVNIYPQEVENLLTMHPGVADVAVIGVPDDEMGEQVKAVVQPTDPDADTAALEQELITYCREHLAHYKCPRTVDFRDSLPRLPTGKLLKRQLRDEYAR